MTLVYAIAPLTIQVYEYKSFDRISSVGSRMVFRNYKRFDRDIIINMIFLIIIFIDNQMKFWFRNCEKIVHIE